LQIVRDVSIKRNRAGGRREAGRGGLPRHGPLAQGPLRTRTPYRDNTRLTKTKKSKSESDANQGVQQFVPTSERHLLIGLAAGSMPLHCVSPILAVPQYSEVSGGAPTFLALSWGHQAGVWVMLGYRCCSQHLKDRVVPGNDLFYSVPIRLRLAPHPILPRPTLR